MRAVRTVLVTVQGPDRRVDVDIPLDRPVSELLPELVRAVDPTGAGALDASRWSLGPKGGRPWVPTVKLADCGALDGSVLELKESTAWQAPPPEPPAAAPVEDDGLGPRQRVRVVLPFEPSGFDRVRNLAHAIAAPSARQADAGPAQLRPGTPLSPSKITVQHGPTMLDRMRASWRSTNYLARLDVAIAAPQLRRCVTIAVVSPKGGVGKTTVTALLGTLLALVRRDRIVAIDTNPDFGSLGRVLAPDHGVFVDDLLGILDGPNLTVTELDAQLGRSAHGLMVLPAPTDPARMGRIDEAAYTKVVRRLQDMVGVVLLDCGTGLQEPAAQAALKTSDQVLLISDAVPATASLVAEAASLLHAERVPIWLVINKARKDPKIDLGALEGYVPQARGMVLIPDHPRAADTVSSQTFDWRDAPYGWRRSVRELATALVRDWPRLGAVR
jgi:MinD-like ATPase involved in chromosome partitioning or flagellar assembly